MIDNTTFQNQSTANEMNRDRSFSLIASDKVEGTAVYDMAGEKLGTVRNFMVNKSSGQAEYAVMSFGGFLGMGQDQHPIPWNMLNYSEKDGGYVVDLDKDTLTQAPRYSGDEDREYGADYRAEVDGYYGMGRWLLAIKVRTLTNAFAPS
jgi:PRC-barrel domain